MAYLFYIKNYSLFYDFFEPCYLCVSLLISSPAFFAVLPISLKASNHIFWYFISKQV